MKHFAHTVLAPDSPEARAGSILDEVRANESELPAFANRYPESYQQA